MLIAAFAASTGVSPKRSFSRVTIVVQNIFMYEVGAGWTPAPARETRALPAEFADDGASYLIGQS
jgi:hypothetical protein